jgi:hypothetical protein
MKKRILSLILLVLLARVLSLPVFADTFIYLYSSNFSDDPKSITQETGYYSSEEGYIHPKNALDYASGISSEDITAKSFNAVHLLKSAVWSDYFKKTFDIAENLAPDTYNEKFVDLPIENSYDIVGISGISEVSYFPYFDGSNDYIHSIDGETLTGQLGWGGATITRNGPNEFGDYYGTRTFNYNPYTHIETRDIAYFDEIQTFKVEYVTMLNVDYYIHFSVSNVGFKDGKIVMDIDGEEAYRYTIRTDMNTNFHGGMAYQPEEEEKFEEESWEKYSEFKKNTEKTVDYPETRHAISVKGAEAKFVLYDLEDGDKNLLLEVDQGGIELKFIVSGVIMSDKAPVTPGVIQNAGENPGEDGGVSVPAAVVVSVLGGGAAIAGAAAASGGSDDKKKKHKAYKMYVQKDFGDAIRRGGNKPVKIRARMAEVDESGAEHDRNDLTANIGVSADGMTVHGAALAGRYCEAAVSVPKEYDNDTASITFTFTGEGGSFTNTVIFRIVDGPSLKFVEETEKAGDYRLYTGVAYIDAIPGDGFTYTEQFMIVDAPVAPKISDITAVNTGNYDVKFELTDRQAVYKMTVKNNTKPEPEHDVFAKVKEENFEIHVTVEGEKEPVKGYVTVKLYPEGITVQSRDEGKKNSVKYVRVQAYEKEYVGDFDKKWQVSQIKFTLAAIGKDKAIIDPREAKYKFEKLKGAGGLGMRAYKEQNLAEKYEYKEAYGEMNGKFTYEFEPNANLAEPEDGTFFMVILPASCEYDGRKYEAEIPLRLRGKDPDPMGDWEKEYKELQRLILQYSLPEHMDRWIAQLKECATEPRASAEEMRLVGKWILREYMNYWTTQQSRDQTEATMYNVIVNVLEWTKFAGDCAFSFLVNAYAGPVADALISPAKDFITGAIGEVIAARNYGEEIDVDKFEFSKNLAAAGDNLISNEIKLTDWRKAAATLGGYFCYCAVKNYILKLREKNEADFYGALCEAFKDMTAAALKSKAGDLIGKWLKESKKFQEKIGPFIAKYFKETNFDTLQKQLNDSLGLEGELRKLAGYANDKVFEAKVADAVEKYIGGLVGAGFDKVREVYDGSKFVVEGGYVYYCFNIDLFDAFHYGIKLNLTKTLQAMSGDFFGWFYDLFFAGVPAAQSVMKKPKDPPLPPAKD